MRASNDPLVTVFRGPGAPVFGAMTKEKVPVALVAVSEVTVTVPLPNGERVLQPVVGDVT